MIYEEQTQTRPPDTTLTFDTNM